MYCPSCGNDISVELKYCNRCGANLTQALQNLPAFVPAPLKLTGPTLVLGLTIVGGLGVIFAGVTDLAMKGVNPAALVWIIIFSMATLFGTTSLLLRFWSRMLSYQRETRPLETKKQPSFNPAPPPPSFVAPPQLAPRLDHVASVTEHTTRTFSPAYVDKSERS